MNYINSLLSGLILFKAGNEYIYVRSFSAEDKSFADFFSEENYEDALLDGIWTQAEAEQYLIDLGFWSKEEEEEIQSIDKKIEIMKVDYFNHFYNSSTKQYIKTNIDKQKKRHDDLYMRKNVFYDKTCEYLRSYSFYSYLLQKNAFMYQGDLAYLKFSSQVLFTKYNAVTNKISSELRNIAKSNEWKNRWLTLKDRVFQNNDLSDLQIGLLSWSNYYDNVYQSMDKPSDDIINDDIALDGWAIKQKKKRIEEEKKINAEKMLPKNISSAGEVFIPAKNHQEVDDIISLNDIEGIHRMKSIKKDLETHGHLKESQLSDTRRDLQMKSVELARENRRK